MSQNPYVKPLNPFDPKKDLLVNEKFNLNKLNLSSDALSDLESEDLNPEGSTDSGKERYSYKTGGSIRAGILKISTPQNKTLLLVSNKSGEIYLLSRVQDKLKPEMKFKINGSIIRTPVYVDGIIYCTTRQGVVYAINTGFADGDEKAPAAKPEVLWQKKMKKSILTEPIATGKLLIVTSLEGIFGFEAYYQPGTPPSIGRPLWHKALGGVVSSPMLNSGIIYIGTEDKQILGLEYGGSKINPLWAYKANEAVRNKPAISQQGENILAASLDGSVYCLNAQSGKLKWIFLTQSPVYSTIVSSVIGGKEYFYIGADNGVFYCVNAFGKKVWQYKTNGKIRTEPIIEEGIIYFGSEDNHFYSLNIKNGKLIHKFRTDGNINGKPLLIDNVIFFGSTDTFVHGIER